VTLHTAVSRKAPAEPGRLRDFIDVALTDMVGGLDQNDCLVRTKDRRWLGAGEAVVTKDTISGWDGMSLEVIETSDWVEIDADQRIVKVTKRKEWRAG
jgi:hypothetical protein